MSTYNPYFVSTKRRYPQKSVNLYFEYFIGILLTTMLVMVQNIGTGTLGIDKLQHFGVSALLFIVFSILLRGLKGQVFVSFFMAFSVGVGKEIFDHQGDILDIAANSVGLGFGGLLLFSMSFVFCQKGFDGKRHQKGLV